MSFRLFIYWCALCGGWAAVAGWGIGRIAAHGDVPASTAIKGMCLGMMIALALGVVDALWVFSPRQFRQLVPRVVASVAVGTVGGLVGAGAGQLLYDWHNIDALLILGWVLTGLMVGTSLGAYDFLRCWVREEELGWTVRKMLRGVVGGALGGLLGGVLDLQLADAWAHVFPARMNLWSPSLTGFIALGMCIGLMIALTQVILQDAWLKVEAGFRSGRELLLARPILTIGRAEACDLGLFGDAAIDKLHARIYQQDGRYLIADNSSATGTFVNDLRVVAPVLLRSGDLIRVGSAYLRFRLAKRDATR